MREGIFGKYNVEVTGIKLGGILQDFVRQIFLQIWGGDVATPQAEKTLSACRLRYSKPIYIYIYIYIYI